MEYIYFFLLVIFGSILLNYILDRFVIIKEGLTNNDPIDNAISKIDKQNSENKINLQKVIKKVKNLKEKYENLSDKIKAAKKTKSATSKNQTGAAITLAKKTIPNKPTTSEKINPPKGINCKYYVPNVGKPVTKPPFPSLTEGDVEKNSISLKDYKCGDRKSQEKIWLDSYKDLKSKVDKINIDIILVEELILLILMMADNNSKNMV
jgi:ATP-dependent Clp protease ATP-binding subunit ClpA